jgi:hypothetical protein
MPQKKRRLADELAIPQGPMELYNKVLSAYLQSTTHPQQKTLLGHLRARDYGRMLDWAESISPQMYSDATSYFVEAQTSLLIKKYPFSEKEVPGIDPYKAALEKFLAAEHRCKRVNLKHRLRRKPDRLYRSRHSPYFQYYESAKMWIERVIGLEPNLSSIYSKCDFTSGASIGVHGNKTNIARKILASDWSVTPTALQHATHALWLNSQYRDAILPGRVKCYDFTIFKREIESKVDVIRYNKLDFVPKTARTHRSIAIEPLLNGFLQKGIEKELCGFLRRIGIDLSNQTRNQALAREGSMGGSDPYATIDLSAASDSISLELVYDLLPPGWVRLLEDARSPSYLLPGETDTKRYHKFCSMGNGFCFPLESLIFASLAHAVTTVCGHPGDFSVYGDDIVVPQSAALLLKEVLGDAGFALNTDKSFIVGPFRESCGADWYAGQDVRPVTFDKALTDLRDAMSLHNSFLRSRRTEMASKEVRKVLLGLACKPSLQFFRPGREPGDTCFSVPLDTAIRSPFVRWDRLMQQWSWKEVLSKATADSTAGGFVLNHVLYTAILRGAKSSQPLSLRYTTTAKLRRVTRPYWDRYNGLSAAEEIVVYGRPASNPACG